jgi:hypothetical protein
MNNILKMDNPFPVMGYYGAALFCDRQQETKLLQSNALNGINTILLAERRMGKTGLLHHTFNLQPNKCTGIYVDIFATTCLKDFTNVLASAILQAYPEKKSIGKKLLITLKSLRPIFSFDSLSGVPEVSFDFAQAKQFEHSLTQLLKFLDAQNKIIIIAIDEFQQILQYPEKNVEAYLRTLIQQLKNVRFIFSGSSQHLLADMFNNVKRPFFSSSQSLYLNEINATLYFNFIKEKFNNHKKNISPEAIDFILEFTHRHTYYTQALCNKIFSTGLKKIEIADAQRAANKILNENEAIYFQYRSLLTTNQWQLLTAIAKSDKVYQPSAKKFIQQYHLGTPANVQRSLESLLNKEMIFSKKDDTGNYYRVYDCFLLRWLASK